MLLDFWTVQQVIDRPEPEWLVQGLIKKGSFVQIHGPPESFKSFVALNWALSVAAGVEWTPGKATTPGNVIYIIGEGLDEFGKRITAWLEHRNLTIADIEKRIRFIPYALQISDGDSIQDLIDQWPTAFEEPPILVVVDTLSRSLVGVDENSAKDMTVAINNLDELRKATGCTLISLHHPPRNSNRGRGSTTIDGALETAIGLSKVSKLKGKMECHKQKNMAHFEDMSVTMVPVADSIVPTFGPKEIKTAAELSNTENKVYEVLKAAGVHGLAHNAWRDACGEKKVNKTAFNNALKVLVENKLVEKYANKIYILPEFNRQPRLG